METILRDYSVDSVIAVYNQLTGSNIVLGGLEGVRECFVGLFASLYTCTFTAPIITVKKAPAHEPGSFFFGWNAAASGYSVATDTFIFDSSSEILWQNVVVSSLDPRGDGSITRVDNIEAPTGSVQVHDGWSSHLAAFGGQDVDMIMADYVEVSEITVCNDANGSSTTLSGLSGVR